MSEKRRQLAAITGHHASLFAGSSDVITSNYELPAGRAEILLNLKVALAPAADAAIAPPALTKDRLAMCHSV